MAGHKVHKQFALYIDHNHKRRRHIVSNLSSMGFEVHNASDLLNGVAMVRKHYYHLVLVRFETVGTGIYDLCSFIRSSNSQAIVITLMDDFRKSIEEKLFDCGVNEVAIGYQTSAPLLKKHINAHLFRNLIYIDDDRIRLKGNLIDFHRKEVWHRGTIHNLSGNLADLLKYFIDNPDRVISREELLQSFIWSDSAICSAKEGGKSFDVSIGRLRKIIEDDPQKPQIIESIRGIGWKLSSQFIAYR